MPIVPNAEIEAVEASLAIFFKEVPASAKVVLVIRGNNGLLAIAEFTVLLITESKNDMGLYKRKGAEAPEVLVQST